MREYDSKEFSPNLMHTQPITSYLAGLDASLPDIARTHFVHLVSSPSSSVDVALVEASFAKLQTSVSGDLEAAALTAQYLCGYNLEPNDLKTVKEIFMISDVPSGPVSEPQPDSPLMKHDKYVEDYEERLDREMRSGKIKWESAASCGDFDPDLFQAEKKLASKICSLCIVRDQCLFSSLQDKEPEGFRAGLSANRRNILRKELSNVS